MKYFFSIILFINPAFICFSQISSNVYFTRDEKLVMGRAIKNSTLIIPLPSEDTNTFIIFKKIFKETWTFCPLKFVPLKDTSLYSRNIAYSFFLPEGDLVTTTWKTNSVPGISYQNTYFSLAFSYWRSYKFREEMRSYNFDVINIFLYTDFKTLQKPKTFLDSLYEMNASNIYNWSPGFFKNYLQIVQKELDNFNLINTEKKADSRIKELATDTLFIPEYVLIKFNAINGNESKSEDARIMDNYPYPFKVISMKELSDRILQGSGNLFYLHYVKSSATTYVNVIDGRNGVILFSISDRYYAYNLKKKDIKHIAKQVGRK